MVTFKDIFKKSFVEGYSGIEITATTILVALIIATLLAIYIFYIYRSVTRKTFYSQSFNISLVGVTIITAAIILVMQSSVVLSLGMVGALSIVRFRTAIKDPMDLMFLFWAISTGIICGAGLAQVAVILSSIITIVIILLNKIPVIKAPVILVVNTTDIDVESRIIEKVKKHTKYFEIKSRNMTQSTLDMVIELNVKDGGELVRDVMRTDGVVSVALLSHNGDAAF
ncbi:MAG: DUF4956 domain-containing protein [Oscillospiraceae bacterium]|nr:DUF4956 domain-containing protein [Oscillospiraceae bacterium]